MGRRRRPMKPLVVDPYAWESQTETTVPDISAADGLKITSEDMQPDPNAQLPGNRQERRQREIITVDAAQQENTAKKNTDRSIRQTLGRKRRPWG